MNKAKIEKRQFPRIRASLPIWISQDFLSETVDISETGLRFILEKPLLLSKAQVKIELSPKEYIDTEFKVIWNKHLVKANKFTYGVCFIRLKEKDLKILRIILSKCKNLNEDFVNLTQEFRDYLKSTKTKFDNFDANNLVEKNRINFIKTERKKVFKQLDMYFNCLWEIVKNFNKEEYILHQKYFQTVLWCLLRDPVETNRLVCEKPLGYAGDFLIMNYIYDFHNKLLGTSSYEKIMNFYTCNIPISFSVVKRKDFLKKKILEILYSRRIPRILSVGSGPARELLELTQEGKILKPLYFDCLDFEKKALDYIQNEMQKIEREKRLYLHLKLINKNVKELIRNTENTFNNKYDLVYSSGLFDYLSSRVAKKVVENLYKLLGKKGALVVTNAKKESASHRAYYEILGEWYFHHRTKKELFDWARDIHNADVKLQNLNENNSFLFLYLQRR